MSYHLPAEWHNQSAVLLTWPHENTDWLPWLAEIESVYIELSKAITRFQLLVIACHDHEIKTRVTELLTKNKVKLNQVRLFIAPCNDTWARDHGPITLVDEQGQLFIQDYVFNAWGDKYAANLDDKITEQMIQQPFCQFDQYAKVDFILEGGSIESDGRGTLLTTETCLLNPNRNQALNKQQIEQTLLDSLGKQRVIWLKHGRLTGDDTDAHIDTLARFAPEGIVYVSCSAPNDPHYNELKQMERELQSCTDAEGVPYKLFALPWPAPIKNDDDELLPATYANYLIINDAVLVPVYNDANDDRALDIIGQAHPEREIVPIDCSTVIQQFGSLHCLTMQLPENLIR